MIFINYYFNVIFGVTHTIILEKFRIFYCAKVSLGFSLQEGCFAFIQVHLFDTIIF